MTASQLLSSAAIQNLLFEEIHPQLMDAINVRSVERQLLDVKKAPVSGKYYRVDELVGGNFRLEGRAEGGYIPGQDPDTSTYQDTPAALDTLELRFKRRFVYSSVNFTGPMNNAPKTSSGGYEKIAALILQQTMNAMPEMISRKWARGQGSVVGKIAALPGSNVVTLSAANAPGTASVAYPWAGNRFIRKGMVLDCVNGATYTNALRTTAGDRGRQVTAKTRDGTTPQITFGTGSGITGNAWAVNDLLVEFGTRDTAAISAQADWEDKFYDPMGIMDAIQDGSDSLYSAAYYGNQQVSANPLLQSFKVTNSTTAALTVGMLNQLLEQMKIDDLGGDEPDFFYTTPGVYRKLSDSFVNFGSSGANTNPARWVNPGKGFTPEIGVTGVHVNNIGATGGKKFYVSPFAPHYRCFAIKKDTLMVLEDREPGIMNDDGLTLRQIPNTDQWAVVWKWYCSGIVNLKPAGNGYIVGLLGDQNN